MILGGQHVHFRIQFSAGLGRTDSSRAADGADRCRQTWLDAARKFIGNTGNRRRLATRERPHLSADDVRSPQPTEHSPRLMELAAEALGCEAEARLVR